MGKNFSTIILCQEQIRVLKSTLITQTLSIVNKWDPSDEDFGMFNGSGELRKKLEEVDLVITWLSILEEMAWEPNKEDLDACRVWKDFQKGVYHHLRRELKSEIEEEEE